MLDSTCQQLQLEETTSLNVALADSILVSEIGSFFDSKRRAMNVYNFWYEVLHVLHFIHFLFDCFRGGALRKALNISGGNILINYLRRCRSSSQKINFQIPAQIVKAPYLRALEHLVQVPYLKFLEKLSMSIFLVWKNLYAIIFRATEERVIHPHIHLLHTLGAVWRKDNWRYLIFMRVVYSFQCTMIFMIIPEQQYLCSKWILLIINIFYVTPFSNNFYIENKDVQ